VARLAPPPNWMKQKTAEPSQFRLNAFCLGLGG